MTRNVRLSWIAEAEARRVEASALAQRGLCEPSVGVIATATDGRRPHWVRRLVARLAAGPQLEDPPPPRVWPHGGLC